MVPPDSRRISRARRYLGSVSCLRLRFAYGTFTPCGSASQRFRLRTLLHVTVYSPSLTVPLPLTDNGCTLDICTVWAPARSLTTTDAIASLSFPPATEMFHFAGFASLAGYVPLGTWVSPFGCLRIFARLQLPAAFRSLPRPSSPITAQASSDCPFLP